jgi:HK97 family phage portal protein|nr:MAG TPA: portal protein [Caudoviricetes sp.]DAY50907.1 MAG TPA: portal protein [Caudoviricetes sp.]
MKHRNRRSLFELIFNIKKQEQSMQQPQLKMLNSYEAQFTTLSGDTYDSKCARQCIDRIATHTAKLIPRHIKSSISNNIKGEINYLLSVQPNPLMDTYSFIYKIISILENDNNAFVYIARDKNDFITGFYPVLAQNYYLFEDGIGNIFLKFKFINGQQYFLLYTDLIHLRKFYNKHDIFGTNNKVLQTDLETAHTANEGISNAIKTTANLKGILKYNATLKPKDIEESKNAFVRDFLSLENESGIAAMDSKGEFQEINMKPITLDSEQLKQVNYNIFDYYGISESIIRNDYTFEQWNAFYEGVIEPLAMQLSNVFTNKIFSKESIKKGHKIVFTANRLQYASLQDKTNLLKVVIPAGVIKTDEIREVLDFAPLGGEEGERIVQSLNNIDKKIANEYQGGKNSGE